GPLIRSSFEETLDILIKAAAHGEYDDMSGVTDRIIMGMSTSIGTGMFDLILPFTFPFCSSPFPSDNNDVDDKLCLEAPFYTFAFQNRNKNKNKKTLKKVEFDFGFDEQDKLFFEGVKDTERNGDKLFGSA